LIRTVLAYLFAVFSTFFFGGVVFFAALLGIRGNIYFWATRRWARSLLWVSGSRARTHGLDRVDWAKPQVLVSNHVGSFDILALADSIPVRYHFVAKKELERIPIFGPAWKNAGHISIDRGNRQSAIASLRQAAEIMHRDGGVVVIFPEGTRSRTGELQPFKKGAFVLAIEARVPIIPAIVLGSERIMPAGRLRIVPGTVDLYIGEPIPTDGFTPETVDDLVQLVRERMLGMMAGSEQLTVDSQQK
jgi:1-acyl-sn-glycerol-3-phosphate acyltransferase